MKVDYRMTILPSEQRTAAFRVAATYRTVPKSAILVISGVIPVGLQASERKRRWENKNVHGQTVNVDDARNLIIKLAREMKQ